MTSARLLLAAVLVTAAPLAAQEKPVQLSLFTPVQIVPETQGVSVIRINLIYSKNTAVKFIDLGLLVNMTTKGPSSGIQWAGVSISEGAFTGWQSGLVAMTNGRFVGLQTGGFDRTAEGEGLMWGVVNVSDNWEGVQLGVVNYAKKLHGVQVGLINIIKEGGVLPFLPIVNWSF